jgi:methylmalonyl-CoA mutase N-terminal domain/subunit
VALIRERRAARDEAAADAALADLVSAAEGDTNLIEPLVACARAGNTEGEIVQALEKVFGDYRETPVF